MSAPLPRVVIVGGGFAGINAARVLGKHGFPVSLVDRNNYHLFQPLLYQVATGFIAPGDIAAPLRSVLSRYKTVRVYQDEIIDLSVDGKYVTGRDRNYEYDILILAPGVSHSYFGHTEWEEHAPGLKTINDAIEIRSRVLRAFEAAERTNDPQDRAKHLSFVVVGGGPTGVELSGALAELAFNTMSGEFRNFSRDEIKITLVEGGSRLLSSFHQESSEYTTYALEKLGVKVLFNAMVTAVRADGIYYKQNNADGRITADTILWAAGVQAVPLADVLAKRLKAEHDRAGRLVVEKDFSVAKHPEIFVLGDLASYVGNDNKPLPGVAPAAIQQGKYLARMLIARQSGKTLAPFRYFDKGMMAVVGRGRAVAETGNLRMRRFPAWVAWALTHIYYLIEFENKFIVFFHWAWNYLTNNRGSRLITRD